MSPYREEESDPGTDDPAVDIPQVIDDLKSSRHVVHVAEYTSKTFEENLKHSQEHHTTELSTLQARKDLAEKAIRAAEASTNEFLRDMFVRFGRQEKEALAFQKSSLDAVKAYLHRRIMLKKRGIDSTKFRRVLSKDARRKYDLQWKTVVTILEDKKASGDIMFRTNIPSAYLKRVARQTRELIQGIGGTMTYGDVIQDLAGKFNRIREYMHDDAVIFARNINDLMDRINHQQREIDYLRNVLHEATSASERAEKLYFSSAGSFEETEVVKTQMLADLQNALAAHQDICTYCTKALVDLNERFMAYSDGCLNGCPTAVKTFPHAVRANLSLQGNRAKSNTDLGAPTELTRTFQTILTLTKARDPKEAVQVFHDQINQTNLMQADMNRLEHLLKTVLRPEFSMFESELETSDAEILNRAAAAEKTITDLQDNFDLKVEEARLIVSTQRDCAQEFDNFVEGLLAFNYRISATFNGEAVPRLSGRQSVPALVEMTEKNLHFIAGKLNEYFQMTWDKLQLLIEDAAFLEYRGLKIPRSNNRVVFDTAAEEMQAERLRDPSPAPHPRFLTHDQFKSANEQILDRVRQAESARLKEANTKAEKEEHRDPGVKPTKRHVKKQK